MSEARTCRMQEGDTICGRMAIGYVLLEQPPEVTRTEIPCCDGHAQPFLNQVDDGVPLIRY